jgi:tetratricopeptide (TPR) repeat protein
MESLKSLYNEILSAGPSQGTIFLFLSRMKKEGMLETVIEKCSKALELYPDDIRIRRLLAEACFEAGRPSQAESEIQTVIGKINELMTCYRFQADLFISQGKTTEAIEALKLYLIHCPDDQDSYALLESMLPKEEPPIEIEQAVPEELPPGQVEESGLPDIATATLGEVYVNQGMTKEAIETYEKVVEQSPDDSASKERLDELKNMVEQSRIAEDKEKALIMRKKKMVAILESWLEGIREHSRTGLSIS